MNASDTTPQSESETPPRWRRRSDARPGEIVEAALELFVTKGFTATRMDEIARAAGVTKGTLYLYFPSKEDLFRAVVHETVVPRLEMGERLVAGHTGPAADLLRALVHAWWEKIGDSRLSYMAKLMTAESANFPELTRYYVEEVVLRARRIFASALRRGIESGEFRGDLPLHDAARLVLAPLVQGAAYRHSMLAFDPEPLEMTTYLDLHMDIFLRGIAKTAETETDA
ncbi:MAG TPA: TetR/AcrR family transcriptional regulator [Longimicrobium sp.]|jgi:AcrR family transcriptional regulator|uniref:TetR/AcrR family transcriptional regulator n=1 Tax=Longimicrobium sp. TaxID=2029185 RepID=UPI002EDA7329